jgi:hypothetical protein
LSVRNTVSPSPAVDTFVVTAVRNRYSEIVDQAPEIVSEIRPLVLVASLLALRGYDFQFALANCGDTSSLNRHSALGNRKLQIALPMVEESSVFAFLAENQLTWQLGLNVPPDSNHCVIIAPRSPPTNRPNTGSAEIQFR